MLLVILTINTVIILRYCAKIKKDQIKSLVADKKEENYGPFHMVNKSSNNLPEINKKRITTILTIFILTFAMYIYGIFPLDDMGINFLPTLDWRFRPITALFAASAVIIGFIYKMKEKEIASTFLSGASGTLGSSNNYWPYKRNHGSNERWTYP